MDNDRVAAFADNADARKSHYWRRGLAALVVWPQWSAVGWRQRLLWWGQALLGLASWPRSGRVARRLACWLLRSGQGLLLRGAGLLAMLVLLGWLLLRGSLPLLEGEYVVLGLSAPVSIERDARGVPTLRAANRCDLAFGLGFVHGQERFFQMDLLRRLAAGELAQLLGRDLVPLDWRHRLHGFRSVAQEAVAHLEPAARAELESYVRGVNAGLHSLTVRPPEYLLLRTAPRPWQAEDTFLVLLSMYLTLQQSWVIESALGVAREVLPGQLYDMLSAIGDEWDAPLTGPVATVPPLVPPEVFDLRQEGPQPEPPARPGPLIRPGSNSWAVDGRHSRHGGALLANDMHLSLRLPNIWYRAALEWSDARGQRRQAWGVTLPGGPGLVAGSTGRIAWGLTNSCGDWADLIRLEIAPDDPGKYRTPEGWLPFQERVEWIAVRGADPVPRPLRRTIWGPVLDDTPYHREHLFALRWTAYDASILNLHYLHLLEADNVDEAVAVATRCGSPQCNFLAADVQGDIAWTILGRLPRRVGFDGRTPTSWADGQRCWAGYRAPEETPRLLRPASGRLWTANNRLVFGEELARLGIGGYDRGARAGQIRQRLFAQEQFDEADMLAIQLDTEARFLARWRRLLEDLLASAWGRATAERQALAECLRTWDGQARCAHAGYGLVLQFREQVYTAVLAPLTARCRRLDPTIPVDLSRSQEGVVWRILQERPAHLLNPRYSSWEDLLHQAVERLLATVLADGRPLAAHTWGERNRVHLEHPLCPALRRLPLVGGWLVHTLALELPEEPLDGGWADLPRIQQPFFGATERFAVSPGREAQGYFHMPGGESGHPLSPHYRDGQADWVQGRPAPFLPGPAVHTLRLRPAAQAAD